VLLLLLLLLLLWSCHDVRRPDGSSAFVQHHFIRSEEFSVLRRTRKVSDSLHRSVVFTWKNRWKDLIKFLSRSTPFLSVFFPNVLFFLCFLLLLKNKNLKINLPVCLLTLFSVSGYSTFISFFLCLFVFRVTFLYLSFMSVCLWHPILLSLFSCLFIFCIHFLYLFYVCLSFVFISFIFLCLFVFRVQFLYLSFYVCPVHLPFFVFWKAITMVRVLGVDIEMRFCFFRFFRFHVCVHYFRKFFYSRKEEKKKKQAKKEKKVEI